MDDELLVASLGLVDRIRQSRKVRMVACYAIESTKTLAKAGADVASRVSITVSHGPVTVSLAPRSGS